MSTLTLAVRNARITLEMIKWEHSIFALPFALTGTVLASHSLNGHLFPHWTVLAWIILCMVSGRTAAMAFNRLADARLDAANPRTATRALPAGLLAPRFVAGCIVLACAIFVFAASRLNSLTLYLSPVALAVLLSYSYTKRFTRWSHLVLGLALGIAPAAAWIAVRGTLDPRIIVLTAAVMFWVAGFDVLYACQDFEHDRSAGLNSIPQSFGLAAAFWIARAMHVIMLGLLIWLHSLFSLGIPAAIGIAVVAALLVYEHSIVSPRDLRRLNAAFFTLNGVISVLFFLFVAADLIFAARG